MHHSSEYPNDFDHAKIQQQHKLNGFAPNSNYRASFSSFPNTTRTRHQTNQSFLNQTSFRDLHAHFPTSPDAFQNHLTSPVPAQIQTYESRASYDFGNGQSGLVGGPKYLVEPYGPSSAMVQPHHNPIKAGVQQATYATVSQYTNGVHLSSQTPYGPHVATSGPTSSSAGIGINAGSGVSSGSGTLSMGNGANSSSNLEEISTIFVVGFPEDMQEREFQNMFTFSPGFEAATLKIPNKEYTAYGGLVGSGTATAALRSFQGYSGSNDPYNLVTVNQGGVVVDGGRDGTMTSWPATVPGDDGAGAHFLGGASNMPPRKQIIGFAKFRSREEALGARDVLQGRRVDIEKGAVLKAEMAKKNLHTKRGVGPVPGSGASAVVGSTAAVGNNSSNPTLQHINGTTLAGSGADTYTSGDEGASIGLGQGLGRLSSWREHAQPDVISHSNGLLNGGVSVKEEEDRRREQIYNAMGLGPGSGTRGPRERAEEEERERRRHENERKLRTNNSLAFDACYAVPAAISRQNSYINGGPSLLYPTVEGGSSIGSSPHLANTFAAAQGPQLQPVQPADDIVGPWDRVHKPASTNIAPGRPSSSQRSSSPPLHEPSDNRYSPFDEDLIQHYEHGVHQAREHREQPESSASSVGSHGVLPGSASALGNEAHRESEADLTRVIGDLVLSTNNGTTSPQLPSPSSGASSASARNAIDQNPPINTLYVGNLPTSPTPIGFPQDYLEESLRELFSSRPGFRRLCFRQKNNGPMCFVEFEDVQFAAKALNDLYGNTLKGLVKGGGIRLSYSKNPLGVRTPTSASGPTLQQQPQVLNVKNSHQGSTAQAFHPEAFQSRMEEQSQQRPITAMRRDVSTVSSPPATGLSYNNSYLTSPPPRFYSSSPGTSNVFGGTSTTLTSTSNAFVPRGGGMSLYSYNLATSSGHVNGHASSTTFAPFGMSTPPPSIPEQTDEPALHSSQHFIHHRALSPPVSNSLEAARAG